MQTFQCSAIKWHRIKRDKNFEEYEHILVRLCVCVFD